MALGSSALGSTFMPTPGSNQNASARPSTSAMEVTTSK